jgi:hypothetical protein
VAYTLLLIALLVALPLPAGAHAALPMSAANPPGPTAPTAIHANAWYDGLIQYSSITNCVSIIQGLPYQENGAGSYVGFLADPNAGKPAPNTIYYVHVVVAGLGNACSGMRAWVEVALPANTAPAIDQTNRVSCLYDNVQIPAAECPQSLPASAYNPGSYAIPSVDAAHAHTWPIPQGHILEIQIPVRSSTALTNSTLQGNVWMFDGNSSPWLRPQQGVYVFSSSPTILYPSPSTITITTTSGHSQAYLYAFGSTGTGFFDLGATPGYGLIHEAVPIATSGNAWLVWDDWGPPALQPDTLYHWRFTFTTTGGQSYVGADQTFRTLPDGHATVGQGQAAGCTEAAFNSALAGAKEIAFNCGSLPVTITVTGPHTVAANLTINGGNKVTLASNGAGNHFNVPAGVHLTLAQIALADGLNTTDCGGAVRVLAGGQLTLNETRFINNRSNFQGGAICNYGTAAVAASLFTQNKSVTSHGGAIGNYGSLTVVDSKFTSNTAAINGGAIDMGGTVLVNASSFISNTAGYRGGGINTYGGNLTLSGSSFSGNYAGLWGGGLANDASNATVSATTFAGNISGNQGGGVEMSGAGSLTLTNSTLSANRASTDGGGLYWTTGSGPITLLNETLAANVAQGRGGNIYVGGVSNPNIHLTNTLVASGTPDNCDHTLDSQANNLESANTCGLGGAGDKINTNPKLGALQNNGGATLTHALLAGSPAIDTGTNSGCPAVDQRGVARPIDGNHDGSALCDIGAVEAQPAWLLYVPAVRR